MASRTVFPVAQFKDAPPPNPHEWIEISIPPFEGSICVWGLMAGELFVDYPAGRERMLCQFMQAARNGPPAGADGAEADGQPIFGNWQDAESYFFVAAKIPAKVIDTVLSTCNRLSGFVDVGADDEADNEGRVGFTEAKMEEAVQN